MYGMPQMQEQFAAMGRDVRYAANAGAICGDGKGNVRAENFFLRRHSRSVWDAAACIPFVLNLSKRVRTGEAWTGLCQSTLG